jgi:antitoxin FitA
MAQLVVRNLEDSVKRQLKKRADEHGRSLEGEVREILRQAVGTRPLARQRKRGKGLGTVFHSYFKDLGVELEPMPRQYLSPPDFE